MNQLVNHYFQYRANLTSIDYKSEVNRRRTISTTSFKPIMNKRLNVVCRHHIACNFLKKLYSHRDENKYFNGSLIFQCLFELLSRIKNNI